MTPTRQRVQQRRKDLGVTRSKTRRPDSFTKQRRRNRQIKDQYWAHVEKFGG